MISLIGCVDGSHLGFGFCDLGCTSQRLVLLQVAKHHTVICLLPPFSGGWGGERESAREHESVRERERERAQQRKRGKHKNKVELIV